MKKLSPGLKNKKKIVKWADNGLSEWQRSFAKNYDRAAVCSKFLFGIDEWDPAVVSLRDSQDKETLSANFCNKFYKQLKSEILEVNVTLDVSSHQDLSDNDDLLDSEIIEQIILSSSNLEAFRQVADDCLTCGFGVVEIVRSFEDGVSTNKILTVRAIKNIQNCFFDLTSADATFSKARFCGYKSTISAANLVLNYPHLAKQNGYENLSKNVDVWDFYWKESYSQTFYQKDSNHPAVLPEQLNPQDFIKRHQFKKFKRNLPMICRARFIDDETEDFLIAPEVLYRGDRMPLVYWPMMTQRYFSSERTAGAMTTHSSSYVTTPYIYHFLGLQQSYNYVLSQATTLVAQATGRKYFLTKDQAIADLEKWSNINSESGAIFYSREQEGIATGQPNSPQVQIQVDASEPLQPTLLNMLQLLQNTFNDLSGNYAAQQGAPDNTVSGAAADIKVSQSLQTNRQMINAHIAAIDVVGSILQQWIPQVYTERRVFRLPTGRLEAINDRQIDAMRGITIKNDIRDLLSTLRVRVGSGISTRQERKNAVQSLINIMSTTQNSLSVLGPVLAMNWEGDGKEVLGKLLSTLLSKEQFDLLKGRITEEEFFQMAAAQQQQQQDPKGQLEQQKIQQQIANIAANTEAAKARTQKALMDTGFVEKQIKEPLNVEKTAEYADLAKEKQIAQIAELKTREQMTLAKLIEKQKENGTNGLPR
jgi:hypothetical protein